MEQITKKRKKRKNALLTNFDSLTEQEVFLELSEIRLRLRKVFKKHVGLDKAITPKQLFEEVFYMNPEYIDVFKREYWWNVIKSMLRKLRSEEILFVVSEKSKLYVLSTQEEADTFKRMLDKDISAMKNTKIKADRWVNERRYLSI